MESPYAVEQVDGEPARYMLQLADAPQADALLAYLATLDFVTISPVKTVDQLTAHDYRQVSRQQPLRMLAKSTRNL